MKKLIAFTGILIGILAIFITSLANRVTSGLNVEAINEVLEFVPNLDFANLDFANEEAKLILTMVKIAEHSHLIITLGVICITIFVFMLISLRRSNNE